MTSLTINTPASNINAIMSINSASSFEKKVNNKNSFFSYITAPKSSVAKKSSSRIFQIDWDLNMNELEFE